MQGAQCVGGSRRGSALSRSPASSWWAAPKAATTTDRRRLGGGRDRQHLRWHHRHRSRQHAAVLRQFTEDTGIIVEYTGDKGFEGNIVTKVAGGDAPDIAIVPQPGLLKALVDTGEVKPAPEAVEANVDENWSPDWKTYGTIDDVFYAAPMLANVKGYVWYSPASFAGVGRRGPHDVGRAAHAHQDHPGEDGPAAVVRRLRVRARVRAGRAPTGSRTWSCASPVPRSTTSGSRTRSSSPIPRSRTRSTRSARSCRTRTTSTRDSATWRASTRRRSRNVAAPVANGTLRADPPGVVPRRRTSSTSRPPTARLRRWRPTATSTPSSSRASRRAATRRSRSAVSSSPGSPTTRPPQAVLEYMSTPEWADARVELGGNISANLNADPSLASSQFLTDAMKLAAGPQHDRALRRGRPDAGRRSAPDRSGGAWSTGSTESPPRRFSATFRPATRTEAGIGRSGVARVGVRLR